MASVSARRHASADRIRFAVLITTNDSRAKLRRQRVQLEARIDAEGIVIGFPEDF
jgi:hypothetical protein